MKIAILSTNHAGHTSILAEDLYRMLTRIGVESKIFIFGIPLLLNFKDKDHKLAHVKNKTKHVLLNAYLNQLATFDIIVVVAHVPIAYMTQLQIENIRNKYPQKPIVLYELIYLPIIGGWEKALREGNLRYGIKEGGHYGLERYDWYLLASDQYEHYIGSSHKIAYSIIGLDIDDGSLFLAEKSEFLTVIDFEQPQFPQERLIQIKALEETHTRYLLLEGRYPIKEIRRIYQRTCIFLIQFLESFGLPICELQACGSYIFTPYAKWCPSHWLQPQPEPPLPGKLSPNFIVYNNDKDELIRKIEWVKDSYNPKIIVDTFMEYHKRFFNGNLDELQWFVEMVDKGKITSESHLNYIDQSVR